MKCRDLKSELQQLADGSLSDEQTASISQHLVVCPLCRDELATLRSLRNELRGLFRPEIDGRTFSRLKALVAAELSPGYGYPSFRLIESETNWWQKWLLPTTAGTFASLVLGILLLGVILIPSNVPEVADVRSDENRDPLYLANVDPVFGDQFITPREFALSRNDVSTESPSINPAGTLVEMASNYTRNPHSDEELVVVADVYGDGEARITDVVESSRDKRKMERLQAAFRADRIAPPFVPANLDNRNEVVRVILKFQNVDVNIEADGSLR